MSVHSARTRLLLLLLAPLAALTLAGPAAATAPTWMRLAQPTMLQAQPGDDGEQLLILPVRDQEGEIVAVPVLRRTARTGADWLKVRFKGTDGWIPGAATIPAPPDALPLVLRQRLAALMNRMSAAGAVISDSNGRPLFSRNAATRRILASNTKLFVTGAALDRFGARVGGLLGRILRPSDNVLSQRLLTRLGGASAARGSTATEGFARAQGAFVNIADGSGLSRANRATPHDVVTFLVGMRHQPAFWTWLEALPVTGRTGTLAYRLRATAAERACQAKTGTLHDVSTLSGYCTTTSGRRVVFSLLMNDVDPASARALQDRMLASLVALG